MTHLRKADAFRQNGVAMLVSLLLTQSAYALQNLSDTALSETTGEGVALVPENFKMVFQGPNDISAASSYGTLTDKAGLLEASKKDTGFIRIIPAGANYNNLFEQNRQASYDNSFYQEYTSKIPALYKSNYTDVYDKEYARIYDDTVTRASVKAAMTSSYKESLESSEVEKYAASAAYQTKYTQIYNQRRADKLIGLPGCTWCAHSESEENSAIWAYGEVRKVIGTENKAAIDIYVNTEITNKTNTEMKLRAVRSAKELAKTAYAVKEAELRASATSTAQNILKMTDHVAALKTSRTKADVFIYGLALSKSNDDMNQRYSNQGLNWGSTENPWLFRSGTASDIQQFKKENKSDIAYIALEAPLAKVGGNTAADRIKLGFWTDIFSRSLDSSSYVDPITGAPTSGLDKDYRLRAQFVANGLSIDGSQVRLFQTQSSNVMQQNQTLGMASILRLNTNDDPSTLKLTDTNLNARGIRISTAAKTNLDDGIAPTPAMDGSHAPLFNEFEGLYLYSANINLVLGNMYQPFILGSEGNNIILEVTRIPNVPEIYAQIYTLYTDTDPNPTFKAGTNLTAASFKGATCNVAYCGSNTSAITAGGISTNYQGTNATHSSISIGSVTRDATANTLKANRDASATGIVFKSPTGSSINLGSAAIDGVLIQHLKIKTTGL